MCCLLLVLEYAIELHVPSNTARVVAALDSITFLIDMLPPSRTRVWYRYHWTTASAATLESTLVFVWISRPLFGFDYHGFQCSALDLTTTFWSKKCPAASSHLNMRLKSLNCAQCITISSSLWTMPWYYYDTAHSLWTLPLHYARTTSALPVAIYVLRNGSYPFRKDSCLHLLCR